MPAPVHSLSVPEAMQPAYDAVTALTDAVCAAHRDNEYRDLARAMTAALCRKRPSPLASGQPRSWASGIVYELGQLNFLSDPSFPPVMTTKELCAAFGVGVSTAQAKAAVIRTALGTNRMDPAWVLPSLTAKNLMIWMAEVDGFLVDLRTIPREVQEIAFEKGMIPYGPADQEYGRIAGPASIRTQLRTGASPTQEQAHGRPMGVDDPLASRAGPAGRGAGPYRRAIRRAGDKPRAPLPAPPARDAER